MNAALSRSLEKNVQELLDLHACLCSKNHRELSALARCIFPWWSHQGAGQYAVVGLGYVASFRSRAEAEACRDRDPKPDLYVVADVWCGTVLRPGDDDHSPSTDEHDDHSRRRASGATRPPGCPAYEPTARPARAGDGRAGRDRAAA